MKKSLSLITLCFLFFFLLIYPAQTLEASKTGILLWFDTLLPALLPFLIISQLILKTSLVSIFQKLSGPLFRHLFHCSSSGAFCVLCGFLCGYPVGARLIALQLKEKRLTLSEGQYLLSFCNHLSPAFCISYGILYGIGSKHVLPYVLLLYGSALLYGFLKRPSKQIFQKTEHKKQTSPDENIFSLIDVCIIDSFLILIKLCGYLILFTIFSSAALMFLPVKNGYITALICSMLEITGGLSKLSLLPHGLLRSAIAILSLSFGGLCCLFQTNTVISDTELSLKTYVRDKLLTALLSLFLYFLWYFFHSFAINRWC